MAMHSKKGAANPFEAMRDANFEWQARDLARAFAIARGDSASEILGDVYACCRFVEFGNLDDFLGGRFFASFQNAPGEFYTEDAMTLRALAQDFLVSVDAWVSATVEHSNAVAGWGAGTASARGGEGPAKEREAGGHMSGLSEISEAAKAEARGILADRDTADGLAKEVGVALQRHIDEEEELARLCSMAEDEMESRGHALKKADARAEDAERRFLKLLHVVKEWRGKWSQSLSDSQIEELDAALEAQAASSQKRRATGFSAE